MTLTAYQSSSRQLIGFCILRTRITELLLNSRPPHAAREARLAVASRKFRFARDSPLEGDGFELPVPRALEPPHLICLLDTVLAFCRGTDAELGTEAISRRRKEAGGLPITVCCTRSKRVVFLFTHLLGRAM